jgi:hypothetical protein
MLFISNFALELYNLNLKKMRILRTVLFVVFIFILEKCLLYFDNHSDYFANYAHDTMLAIIIIVAIILFALIFYKIRKSKLFGLNADDELSKVRKYKAGYFAFYMNLLFWLLLYSDRIRFTDISNLMGGGILTSLFIGIFSLLLSSFGLYDEQN